MPECARVTECVCRVWVVKRYGCWVWVVMAGYARVVKVYEVMAVCRVVKRYGYALLQVEKCQVSVR